MRALAVLVLLLLIGAGVYFFSGAYDIAASNPDPQIKRWVLSHISDASVERHSKDIAVPALGAPEQVRLGFHEYDDHCAICHGSPAAPQSGLAKGLNPHAPRFTRGTDLTPRELFWVTKHGIQMTGMPAWGASHSDDEIWAVVAFIPQVSKLSAAQYQAMQREPDVAH